MQHIDCIFVVGDCLVQMLHRLLYGSIRVNVFNVYQQTEQGFCKNQKINTTCQDDEEEHQYFRGFGRGRSWCLVVWFWLEIDLD